MSPADFAKLGIQLATMLAFAIAGGELMRRLKQPAVVGEMLGGIILGPSLLGIVAPEGWQWLFGSSPALNGVRDAWTKLGMVFFLFFAGLETDLSDLRRVGKTALAVGLVGTILPILAGMAVVYAIPSSFWGPIGQTHLFAFGLFFGMNLANSANPVIARVLMDLGLYHSQIGTVTIAATLVDDLVNWTLFAIVLADFAPASAAGGGSVAMTSFTVVAFLALVLVVGRGLGPRTLHWARSHMPWPTGFLSLTAVLVLLAASTADYLGIHAFFGAFMAGVALSGRDEEHVEAHNVIGQFVLSFFAPVYFVSLGMSLNFAAGFDAVLVLLVIAVACVTKIGSVLLGAWMAGLRPGRVSLALGFGLNARGATGIILAGVGLANGVIDERLFMAMALMAIVTSLMAAPAMKHLLFGRKPSLAGLSQQPGALTFAGASGAETKRQR